MAESERYGTKKVATVAREGVRAGNAAGKEKRVADERDSD
jgi:hypothetical protein